MVFSDSTNQTGIVERSRKKVGLDSTQFPTSEIVNSSNDWLDTIAAYMLESDRKFQWDDTNHTKLPEGTTSLKLGQSDYSFLVDQDSNKIVTLLGISILRNGYYQLIDLVDRNEIDTSHFGQVTGDPTQYDKIADNIIRLNYKPSSTVASGLKFDFQRTGSYFVATDTTKEPGVSPLLHRGFVIACAYDKALSLGLPSLQGLNIERQLELAKFDTVFASRNNDDSPKYIVPEIPNYI